MDDVIVVGAGPAGNNAALELASMGYSVTVIDARTKIGDKLCTGIVGQECARRFPIDPALVHKQAYSAQVNAPDCGQVRFETDVPQAQIVDRVGYVSSFARRAMEAGATYLLGHRVERIASGDDGVSVFTHQGRHQSRSLILAAGFGSPLTRQIGLESVSDYVTGTQVEVSVKALAEVEVFVGKNVAPGFFSWLVPTSQGLGLVGLLARQQAPAHLESFLARLQQEGKIEGVPGEVACWGIPLRPLRRTYQDRVLVVGDAAGQVKPTTGGGIYYSLLASEIAAHTMDEALSANDLSAVKLSEYQKGWKRLLSQELEVGYSARRLFEALSDNQISSLVQQAGTNGTSDYLVNSKGVSFDWHSRMIRQVMAHPVLGGALRLVNPLLAHFAHPPDPTLAFSLETGTP